MTLKAVDPIDITEAVLTASDIPEPDLLVGESEWQNEATRFIQETLTPPPGYGFSIGIYYVSGLGYFTCVRSNSTISTWAVARYDEDDFSLLSTYPLSTPAVGSVPTVTGFSYSESSGLFTVFWRQTSGSDNFYAQRYSTSLSLSTESQITEIPAAIKSSTIARMCETGGFFYASITNASDIGEMYKLKASGVQLANITNTGESSISPTQDGGVYNTEMMSGVVYITKYDSDLNIESTGQIFTNANTSGKYRIGYSNNVFSVMDENSASTEYILTPYSSAYVNIGSYFYGDEVILSSSHRKYRCVTSQTFDSPETGATGDSTATWIDIGPTNKWAMFDDKTTTVTYSDADFSVTLTPIGLINTISFFGIDGTTSVNIKVYDGDDVLQHDSDYSLIDISPIYDHYTYYFYQTVYANSYTIEDIPVIYSPKIVITFSGAAMSVGAIPFGQSFFIGDLHADGTKSEDIDYSRVEYDEFGELTIIKRPAVNLNTYAVLSKKSTLPYIRSIIGKTRGKNALWIGDVGYNQKLVTYGVYESFPIPYDMPNHASYKITVRGSI